MDTEERIWKYIDQVMDAKERQKFEENMIDDGQLARQFVELKNLHDQLGDQKLVRPSEGFTDRVMYALPATINRSYTAKKFRPYIIGFLAISVLYLIIGLFAGAQQGPVEDWFAQNLVLPSLEYALPAGLSLALVLLLATDHLLQRRLKT